MDLIMSELGRLSVAYILELCDTVEAYILALELCNTVLVAAEMAYGGIFSENNVIALYIYFYGVVFSNSLALAYFLWDNYTAKLVNVSDNSC